MLKIFILLLLFSLSVTTWGQETLDPKMVEAIKSYRAGKPFEAGKTFHQMAVKGEHKDLATIGLRIVRGDYGVAEFTLAHCLLHEAALHGGLREKRILIDFYLYTNNPFNNQRRALVWKQFLATKGDQEVIEEFKHAKKNGALKDIMEDIINQARKLEKNIVRHLNNEKKLEYCPPAK